MQIVDLTTPIWYRTLSYRQAYLNPGTIAGVNQTFFAFGFAGFTSKEYSPAPRAGELSLCGNRRCRHDNLLGWMAKQRMNVGYTSVDNTLFHESQSFMVDASLTGAAIQAYKFRVLLLYGLPCRGIIPGTEVSFSSYKYYQGDIKYYWDGYTLDWSYAYAGQTYSNKPYKLSTFKQRMKVLWPVGSPLPGESGFNPSVTHPFRVTVHTEDFHEYPYPDNRDPILDVHDDTVNTSLLPSPITIVPGIGFSEKSLRNVVERLYSQLLPVTTEEWGTLANAAADDCKLTDINSIAYVKDLVDGESLFKLPNHVEDAYLSYKYGARLTIADTKKLVSALQRTRDPGALSWVRAPYIPSPYPHRFCRCEQFLGYKIYYRDPTDAFRVARKFLDDWDIYPSLENLWDLVPFSFVADWFLNISDTLNSFDNKGYLCRLPVVEVVKTQRYLCSDIDFPSLGEPGVLGSVTIILFKRIISKTIDLPSPQFSGTDSFNNQLELSAILMKKLR